ncbi:MAG: bifunctional nuclease domain-containing protein [Anaerolineales bacterium]
MRARRDWYSLDDWDGGRVAAGFKWPDAQPSPEAAYEIRELHATILNAIALLPREQQAVVRLHYLDGLTLGEIGVLAGSPLGTVKARLHRARERLRAELAHEFAPSASRKEKSRMIEVTVKDVVTQTRADRDVLEANAREAPPPEAQEVRQPLPPGMPGFPRVVLLKEKSGERLLPIRIGPWEGDIIALQLAGKSALRPLTHELTVRLLEAAQLALEQVAVTRLHEECFYATLWVRTKGGQAQEIDARPSDALALALRLNVPIFVAEEVMDSQGVEPERFDEKLAGDQPDAAAPARWVSVPAPDMDKPKK